MATSSTRPWLAAGSIVLLTIAVYVPALQGDFVWDDDDYVTENRMLRSAEGLRHIWFTLGATTQYYPLVYSTFWIEYHLWGLNPVGYHGVNVLLHALAAILLGVALRRLSVPGAWLAAGIFALHPIHVESVAWITERKNVLSAVFYLTALLAYFRFCPPNADERPSRHRGWYYTLSLMLFLLALLSKTVTCSLPAAILLVLWWKRKRLGVRQIAPLLPMFILGALLGLTTAYIERVHLQAEGGEWAMTAIERCLLAGQVVYFYAGKLLWPTQLTFIYPRWDIDSTLGWQYLYPLTAMTTVVTLGLLRKRIGKGPVVATLFFIGTLGPALGFFNVYFMRFSFVADHFQYLASIGLITLFAATLTTVIRFLPPQVLPKRDTQPSHTSIANIASHLIPAIIIVVLGIRTLNQTMIYKDVETLWRDTLSKNPNAWMAHNNLGSVLAKHSRLDEADRCFAEATRLKPNFALAYKNRGNICLKKGQLKEAASFYIKAQKVQPTFAEAYNNLGNVRLRQNRLEEADALFAEAIRHKPDLVIAYHNRGHICFKQGRLEEAAAFFRKALELKPDFAGAHNSLASVYNKQERFAEAARHYKLALALDPSDPRTHYNFANLLIKQNQSQQARQQLQEALRLKPDFAQAHNELANILNRLGHTTDAIHHYRQASDLQPTWPTPANELAWLQATHPDPNIRNGTDAIQYAQRACKATNHENPHLLDTLAAAYAEAGRYQDAIRTAHQAIAQATQTNKPELARKIHQKLERYHKAQPCRSKPTSHTP